MEDWSGTDGANGIMWARLSGRETGNGSAQHRLRLIYSVTTTDVLCAILFGNLLLYISIMKL